MGKGRERLGRRDKEGDRRECQERRGGGGGEKEGRDGSWRVQSREEEWRGGRRRGERRQRRAGPGFTGPWGGPLGRHSPQQSETSCRLYPVSPTNTRQHVAQQAVQQGCLWPAALEGCSCEGPANAASQTALESPTPPPTTQVQVCIPRSPTCPPSPAEKESWC